MSDIYTYLLEQVNASEAAFCRFITANDASLNSHQYGFLVSKAAALILFDAEQVRERVNLHKEIKIRWQNDFETTSKAHYYGAKKNELRVTCFGDNFPFLKPEYIGSLLVMCKMADNEYIAVMLSDDEDIEDFYSQYNIASNSKSYVIKGLLTTPDDNLHRNLLDIINATQDFPGTREMSELARQLYNSAFRISDRQILDDPDKYLLKWIDTEFDLFHGFEEKCYRPVYTNPFYDCQSLIDFSNVILNRRKSRAGKSLEHHLADIFTRSNLRFNEQEVTEDKKKPDFLFPGIIEYRNPAFPDEGLTFLGAKTTCKDRWRQVLNEANRIGHKYLFTLQKGISTNQIHEMTHENLTLVIPNANRDFFAETVQDELISLSGFIGIVKEKQERHFEAVLV